MLPYRQNNVIRADTLLSSELTPYCCTTRQLYDLLIEHVGNPELAPYC